MTTLKPSRHQMSQVMIYFNKNVRPFIFNIWYMTFLCQNYCMSHYNILYYIIYTKFKTVFKNTHKIGNLGTSGFLCGSQSQHALWEMEFIVNLDTLDWLRHMTDWLSYTVKCDEFGRWEWPWQWNFGKILQTLKLFRSQMIPTPPPAAGCLQMSVVIARRATAWQQSEVMCDAAAPLITVVFHQSIVVEEKHSAFCPKRREDEGDVSLFTRR